MTTTARISIVAASGEAQASDADADAAFVGALDTYRLPSSDLAGSAVVLRFDDEQELELSFEPDGLVHWRSAALDNAEGARDPYDAVAVRDDVWFVTVRIASRQRDAVTVFWSTATGRALLTHSWIEDDAVPGRPRCSQSFHAGVLVGAAPSGEVPGPTRDLVGMRNLYRYGPEVLYEHVYLSTERYAWQCLSGGTVGLGDVDPATVWRFDHGLYLFAFREYGIDVATVWLHDLGYELRTTGAFLARGPEGQAFHGQGGGHIYPLGRVVYPDVQPV